MGIIVLDTETTGLGDDDQAIELGIVDLSGDVLFHSLIKPTVPVSQGSIEVHGISENDLMGAPAWTDIHDQVMDILTGCDHAIIYNASFDLRIMQQTAAAHGLLIQPFWARCAMIRFADMFCDGVWQKLTDACGMSGISVGDIVTHRAIGDCKITGQLWLHMEDAQLEKTKREDYRKEVKARKMALVPKDRSGFEYFGQDRRPSGYKTLSQLKLGELSGYEFAGECCSTYGDKGYLFRPKAPEKS